MLNIFIIDDFYPKRGIRIYENICPCLRGERNGLKTVKIKQATKQGYIECEVGGLADLLYPTSKTRRGRVQGNGQISPTLTSEEMGGIQSGK